MHLSRVKWLGREVILPVPAKVILISMALPSTDQREEGLELTGYFVCGGYSKVIFSIYFSLFPSPKRLCQEVVGFFVGLVWYFLYLTIVFFSLLSLKSSTFEFVSFMGSINWGQILFASLYWTSLVKNDWCLFVVSFVLCTDIRSLALRKEYRRGSWIHHHSSCTSMYMCVPPLQTECTEINSFVCLEWAVIRLLTSWKVTVHYTATLQS